MNLSGVVEKRTGSKTKSTPYDEQDVFSERASFSVTGWEIHDVGHTGHSRSGV